MPLTIIYLICISEPNSLYLFCYIGSLKENKSTQLLVSDHENSVRFFLVIPSMLKYTETRFGQIRTCIVKFDQIYRKIMLIGIMSMWMALSIRARV
jgi:hypothetical protein